MKRLLALVLVPFFLFAGEKPITIVISATTTDWMKENLQSVFEQEYENYRVFYCAEGFSQEQMASVKSFVARKGNPSRFTYIETPVYSGPLPGILRAIFQCEKREIIVDLDGSDWLAHQGVFSKINKLYDDENVWLTYGQFISYPYYTMGFASKIPEDVVKNHSFRNLGGAVTHLKTFYAGLFQAINKEDFLYAGQYIPKATDLAYMLPMLEMAGERACYIPEVMYIYNSLSPHRFYSVVEEEMDREIRKKDPSDRLGSFPREYPAIYDQISDLENPTIDDYQFVQDYISHGIREGIDHLGDMARVGRSIQIIGDTPNSYPVAGKIAVNCCMDDKENCLVLYTTLNASFAKGLKRLAQVVSQSDFKGHILYQIGGWPGDITLAHVPYGFKLSSLLEAKKLGYKRALWLDAAVVPLVSLNDIFSQMQEEGYFVMGNSHMVEPYTSDIAPIFWGLTRPQTDAIPSCSAGLFGVDFTTHLGNQLINYWLKAARDRDAFNTPRSDQSALSIILYLSGAHNLTPLDKMPHSREEIYEGALFFLDRWFVHQ